MHYPNFCSLPQNWVAYTKWDFPSLRGALKAILKARNELNHGSLVDISRVQMVVAGMIGICNALQEDSSRLVETSTSLAGFAGHVTVHPVVSDSMRIPFQDPRKYLVGRQTQIEQIAQEIQGQQWCRSLVYGNSGVGKTVLAIAVAYSMREEMPIQVFMEGSSESTFRLELARFARTHVKGLSSDAEEEELVQAASTFLAKRKGQLLLVIDDITNAEGILSLLPVDDKGQPAGHVLMTSTQRHAEVQPNLKSPACISYE